MAPPRGRLRGCHWRMKIWRSDTSRIEFLATASSDSRVHLRFDFATPLPVPGRGGAAALGVSC